MTELYSSKPIIPSSTSIELKSFDQSQYRESGWGEVLPDRYHFALVECLRGEVVEQILLKRKRAFHSMPSERQFSPSRSFLLRTLCEIN